MSILPLQINIIIKNKQIQNITLTENSEMQCLFKGDRDSKIENMMKEWVDCYLSHKQPLVDLPLNLQQVSPFTSTVLKKLLHIPYGQTTTYAQLADKTGHTRAWRAIGNACGRNPFPLIIPCHRVLRSDGKLGGFAFGPSVKKKLIDFEKN